MHSVLVSALWPQRNDSLVFQLAAVIVGFFLLADLMKLLLATARMPLASRTIGPMRGDGHAW